MLISFLAFFLIAPLRLHALSNGEFRENISGLYFKVLDGRVESGGSDADERIAGIAEVSLAPIDVTSCVVPKIAAARYDKDYREHDAAYAVTSIGKGAFYGCARLDSITLPDGLTGIGGYAFYGCAQLTDIVLPNSLTSIGSSAFLGCVNLRNVTCLGEVPPTIGKSNSTGPTRLFPENRDVTVFVPTKEAVALYETAWREYLTDNVTITAASPIIQLSSDP
ncbi:MAG: leucine-rich repeat domain-containing protein [Synergistaceae bacterium]|nr:leucine-rich repeat domain-containing protein [Synergistaceae bacterium]